jgi:radical SAM superfamily enzyme YgiQ (UPF0313 family)
MYKEKQFRIRSIEELIEEIDKVAASYSDVRKIFIADGDALMINTSDLEKLIGYMWSSFGKLERIGIYASPKSIHLKTDEELLRLRESGLGIAYLGLESGNEAILERVKKGDSREGLIMAGKKIKSAGIKLSVTAISGLGGKELWKEHAQDTASAVNLMKPDFLGLLTLMDEMGTELHDSIEKGVFNVLTPREAAIETILMIENLDCEGLVFRSNHASNYFALKGTLNSDRDRMIKELKDAMRHEDFRDESARRL